MIKIKNEFENVKDVLVENYPGDRDVIEEALQDIEVRRCNVAESDHFKDRRTYSHTMHIEETVCVSSSMELLEKENIRGILFHEFGHLIHLAIPFLLDDAEILPGEFGLEIVGDKALLDGRVVDYEIFADAIIERMFGIRIFYDENKIQWVAL